MKLKIEIDTESQHDVDGIRQLLEILTELREMQEVVAKLDQKVD